jgi:hypothetical protein
MPTQYVPVFKEQRFLNLGGVVKAKAILNTMSEFAKAHFPQSSSPPAATH